MLLVVDQGVSSMSRRSGMLTDLELMEGIALVSFSASHSIFTELSSVHRLFLVRDILESLLILKYSHKLRIIWLVLLVLICVSKINDFIHIFNASIKHVIELIIVIV